MLGGFSESFKRAYAGFVTFVSYFVCVNLLRSCFISVYTNMVVKDASLLLAPGARRMRGLPV